MCNSLKNNYNGAFIYISLSIFKFSESYFRLIYNIKDYSSRIEHKLMEEELPTFFSKNYLGFNLNRIFRVYKCFHTE